MSRFDDAFLEELKSRVRPSDLVGKSVKLRRQGAEYAGLSPFSKEKTPSFFVNDQKGFWHCFSSGKHGDVIDWLVETQRLTFPEAIEQLAGLAGLSMPAKDPEAAARDQKRKGLQDWLELAAAWYEGELRRPAGAAAADYLRRRGLPDEVWSRFRIGYAPPTGTGLKAYLVTKGARPVDLTAAGLLVDREDGSGAYDRFRDRIMFPITDARGRVISFGGRALDPKSRAKYLNGPDTDLFDKGRTLYGLAEARKASSLVVVEGYMDVVACQRADLGGVANMGTALTEDQLALAWRVDPEPTLCFDSDDAGKRAAKRAIERALPLIRPGRSLRFASIDTGKDPDDLFRTAGAEALRAQIGRTTNLVVKLFEVWRDEEALDTPERRIGFRNRLLEAARQITDTDLAHAYRRELMDRFEEMFSRPAPGRGQARRRLDGGAPSVQAKAAAEALIARPVTPSSADLMMMAETDPAAGLMFDDVARLEEVEETLRRLAAGASSTEDFKAMGALKRERAALKASIREKGQDEFSSDGGGRALSGK